jgi:hypothetical protein
MRSAPQQKAPTYDSGAIDSYLSNYLKSTKAIQPKSTDFNWSPVSWSGVKADQVSATKEAQTALDFNLSNLGVFTSLAGKMTQADTTARMGQLDMMNPNWRAERDQAGAINKSWMEGEVSADTSRLIERTAGYQSLMSQGYGGESNARALTARDLGKTSTEMQAMGQEQARGWQTLMGGLLPQATSSAQVMANQGLSADAAIQTALGNASNKLQASSANATGMLNAGIANSEGRLNVQKATSAEGTSNAALQMDALRNYTEMATTNVGNKYQADINQSNILFGNINRPWQMQGEWMGMRAGQQASYGYGI